MKNEIPDYDVIDGVVIMYGIVPSRIYYNNKGCVQTGFRGYHLKKKTEEEFLDELVNKAKELNCNLIQCVKLCKKPFIFNKENKFFRGSIGSFTNNSDYKMFVKLKK